MLKREIKFIYLFIYLFIHSCTNNNGKDISNTSICNQYVIENFKSFSDKYKILADSMRMYVDSLLETFQSEYLWAWEIDSMICIDKMGEKLVATININHGSCKECVSESVQKLLGKKINGQWYFFKGGGNLVVPREYYGKDPMHPLTFHELSQIARREYLGSALIKNDNGEYVVNDDWVERHFYNNGFGRYNNHKQYDSVHWEIIPDLSSVFELKS